MASLLWVWKKPIHNMTRFNPQKIYAHQSYTIDELASLIGADEKTCRRWIDDGLRTVPGSKKPILIVGSNAKEFIRLKNSKKKVKLRRHEFYCLKCRGPTRAKRGSIEVVESMKKAICSVCNGKIRKTIRPYQKDYPIPPSTVQMSIFNNNLNLTQNDKFNLPKRAN